MKLPNPINFNWRYRTPYQDERIEWLIRDCVGVIEKKHAELAKRSYPPPRILLELRDAILARYSLEPEDSHE